MKRPTEHQFEIAAAWLRHNEGLGFEGEACTAVADWIERQALDHMLTTEARKAGVPKSKLKERLASR
jgi:hypothetical protein